MLSVSSRAIARRYRKGMRRAYGQGDFGGMTRVNRMEVLR